MMRAVLVARAIPVTSLRATIDAVTMRVEIIAELNGYADLALRAVGPWPPQEAFWVNIMLTALLDAWKPFRQAIEVAEKLSGSPAGVKDPKMRSVELEDMVRQMRSDRDKAEEKDRLREYKIHAASQKAPSWPERFR